MLQWIPASYTMTAPQEVYAIARAQCLIALCSTIPGYYFTVYFIDKMGMTCTLTSRSSMRHQEH